MEYLIAGLHRHLHPADAGLVAVAATFLALGLYLGWFLRKAP